MKQGYDSCTVGDIDGITRIITGIGIDMSVLTILAPVAVSPHTCRICRAGRGTWAFRRAGDPVLVPCNRHDRCMAPLVGPSGEAAGMGGVRGHTRDFGHDPTLAALDSRIGPVYCQKLALKTREQ